MCDRRLVFLTLLLVCFAGFGAACSTGGEVQSGEDLDPSTKSAAEQPADVDAEQWRVIVHPSDPITRHFPQLIPPAGVSHEALPCRLDSSQGEVVHLGYDEDGRRRRFINELAPDTPPEVPIDDTIFTYSYDEDGELVRLVISPVEEDESRDISDITIETVERDEFGNPVSQVYQGWVSDEIRSTYDDEQRLIRTESLRTEDGKSVNLKKFFYDEVGRLARLEEDFDLDGEANAITTYVYGGDGRLREQIRESHDSGKMLEQMGVERKPIVLTYVYECER